MFCVECGREGNVFEALCASCFLDRKKLLDLPKTIDIVSCATCEQMLVGKIWKTQELEDLIEESISASMWLNPTVKVLRHSSDIKFEDERNLAVKVTTRIELDGLDKKFENIVRVRLKPGTCPTCSKRHGKYYEAIIQVRPGPDPLDKETLNEIRTLVRSTVAGAPDTEGKNFISQEQDLHGGVDFYMGSNRAAKAIARDIAKKYGGTVRSSPKLHGRVKGKEVYRVTYIVRLQ